MENHNKPVDLSGHPFESLETIDKTTLEKNVSKIYKLATEVEKIAPTQTGKHQAYLARSAVSEALAAPLVHHEHMSTHAQTMKKLDKIYDNLAVFYDNEDDKLCIKEQIKADKERGQEELQAIKEFNAKNGIINFH